MPGWTDEAGHFHDLLTCPCGLCYWVQTFWGVGLVQLEIDPDYPLMRQPQENE